MFQYVCRQRGCNPARLLVHTLCSKWIYFFNFGWVLLAYRESRRIAGGRLALALAAQVKSWCSSHPAELPKHEGEAAPAFANRCSVERAYKVLFKGRDAARVRATIAGMPKAVGADFSPVLFSYCGIFS